MSSPENICIKCGGNKINGFAADESDQYFYELKWVDGDPDYGSFLGMKTGKININAGLQRKIRGQRCEECGFLELYAA